MAQEKENFLETLFRIGGLIGGGWITLELIKAFSQKVYLCPHCRNEIQYKISKCPHCKVKLVWKV
ncbi:MAG: hypothetical protein AB1567_02910 [bacterium]